jgi:hypothetical protein
VVTFGTHKENDMAAAKKPASTYNVLAPTSTHKATNRDVATAEAVLLETMGVATRHFLVAVDNDTVVYLHAPDGGPKAMFDKWLEEEKEHPAWTHDSGTYDEIVGGAMRYVVEQAIAQVAAENSTD